MEHAAPALFVALEQSAFAAAIRQSIWIYPVANVGHIVALAVFAGAVAIMDVRLLGGFAASSPRIVIARARRAAILALSGLALTGFLLFAAEASHVIVNPVFLVKLALIGAGLANVAIYELGARRAGYASLALWLLVAACGRTIAYL